MKKGVYIIIAGALITLSFTFVSIKHSAKKENTKDNQAVNLVEPVGGFISDDKL